MKVNSVSAQGDRRGWVSLGMQVQVDSLETGIKGSFEPVWAITTWIRLCIPKCRAAVYIPESARDCAHRIQSSLLTTDG